MKKYVENMKEYEDICEKCEGIPPTIYILLDLEKFRDLPLYIVFGSLKNSELSHYIGSGLLYSL